MPISSFELIALMARTLVFPIPVDVQQTPDSKALKKFAEVFILDHDRRRVVSSTLRKDGPSKTFEYRTPVFTAAALNTPNGVSYPFEYRNTLETSRSMGTNPTRYILQEDMPIGQGKALTGAELSVRLPVASKVRELIAEAVKLIEVEYVNNKMTLWVTFRISKDEAEYFNNTDFNSIKLCNFYLPLLDWSATGLGENGKLPKMVMPVAQIATAVKAVTATSPAKPRVGIDGLVFDINNNCLLIPEVDKSNEYEQKLMDFGLRDNGAYTWRGEDIGGEDLMEDKGNDTRKRLPINMPIFTDWLNDKFAYSNSSGQLSVYDLSDTVPAGSRHILKVLNAPIHSDSAFAIVLSQAFTLAMAFDKTITRTQPDATDLVEIENKTGRSSADYDRTRTALFGAPVANGWEYLIRGLQFHKLAVNNSDDFFIHDGVALPRLHQLDAIKGLPTLRFLGRAAATAYSVIGENLEAAYRKYSVMTVTQIMGVLTCMNKHAGQVDVLSETDLTERAVYLNQGVDPNYEVQPIAMIKNDLMFMPHQGKIDNITRQSPPNIVYPVDAGGGKTILILTNVLRELMKGVCKRPVIMCPPHLVAQYIEEVVYVVEGRLNIIPITNATIKAHGFEGLKKLLERAPLNTVVIVDYDCIRSQAEEVAYGNKSIRMFKVAEFLRQFEFDLVALDESHYLKNLTSGRREAVSRFIQDIPNKRIASGTLVSDTLTDLVSQVALFDPTIFGSLEQFKLEFGQEVRGSKVLGWKPGAEMQVKNRIAEHAVFAQAKRKEWAALLPESKERFIAVELTDNQRLLYESILKETMDLINEAAMANVQLREAMASDDDSVAEDLERMLRPYLARLERFLSAPDLDPAGELFLKDAADKVSPKLAKVYEIIQQHIADEIPGKVLIFTQYVPTAESAFMNAPPELRAKGIHYTADNKLECRADFEGENDKIWMVGQSSSMDTGLNFQHVSRLIRLETVWTPGILEQGNSRVNRPQRKKVEKRKQIFFDWIMVNCTVDVTKISRLIAKTISKAKFDEWDNPAYQELPNLPQVPITMESIAANNDFRQELQPYLFGYRDFQQTREADYAEYRAQQGDKIKDIPVPAGGMLPDSKLLSRVPYVAGMSLYGADNLGLLRYDQYVRQDIDTIEDDEVEDSDDETETEEIDGESTDPRVLIRKQLQMKRAKERILARYKQVHTEYGDGEITGIGNKRVRVKLRDGSRVRLDKMKVFVITRATTNSIDMRNELLKSVGDLPLDMPITVPVEEGPEVKSKRKARDERVKEEEVVNQRTGEFDFVIINDLLALKYRSDGENKTMLGELQNAGFRMSPEYRFARMQNHRVLLRLFRAWASEGFKIDKYVSQSIKDTFETFKTRGKQGLSKYGFATARDFANFYRDEIKPVSDPKMIKVYPQIEGGELYMMLPTAGQAGNLKAIRVPVQSVRWKEGGGALEVLRFVKNKAEGKNVLKQLLDSGVTITNLDELKDQYNALRVG
jgi:hypothetical protein